MIVEVLRTDHMLIYKYWYLSSLSIKAHHVTARCRFLLFVFFRCLDATLVVGGPVSTSADNVFVVLRPISHIVQRIS